MEKILSIFKKFGAGFYIGLVSLILIIVGVSMYASDYNYAYYASSASSLLVFSGIISLLLLLVYLILPVFKIGENKYVKIALTILIIVSAVLLAYLTFDLVRDRVYYIAIVLGSDLELGNTQAFDAVYHSIGTIAVLLISMIGVIVTSFFNSVRDVKAITVIE